MRYFKKGFLWFEFLNVLYIFAFDYAQWIHQHYRWRAAKLWPMHNPRARRDLYLTTPALTLLAVSSKLGHSQFSHLLRQARNILLPGSLGSSNYNSFSIHYDTIFHDVMNQRFKIIDMHVRQIFWNCGQLFRSQPDNKF